MIFALVLGSLVLACADRERPSTAEPAVAWRTVMTSEPVQVDIDTPAWLGDPMFACMTDDDCTVLELGCCDKCNGGWQLSVNTRHAEAATRTWAEQQCDTGCTTLECPVTLAPVCDGGVCARREEVLGTIGESRMTIVRNVLPR